MSLVGLTTTSLAVVRSSASTSSLTLLDILDTFISTQRSPSLETRDLRRYTVSQVDRKILTGNGILQLFCNDAARCPDACAFSKIEFWHSGMTYEIRPPSTTSLKVMTGPEYGVAEIVQQEYLESLTAWPRKRRDLARLASKSVASLSKPYTLSFVSPGWKSVYVNPDVTRRMLGVPKSDIILNALFHQVAEDVDFQVRFRWERTVSTQ
ncbi:hypothetical protein CY34DRAFT_12146 [Suillus luteus UH-Slu-Lm8-n1]|uniref:Uncharacterized protein n=1 Tax=Suillus luteus UH-Slu-Lm8-n1 TaxID=930992 RepID=A0A0D0BHX6_9AGAM|nr:hypothetical protein CY34DRAFT_12146 [Suillus luteus UH-Slu-Lm8-n1]